MRGDLRQAVDLATDGMALAERLDDPGMLMEAFFMPGATMFYRGQFAEAPRSLREGTCRLRRSRATKFWTASPGTTRASRIATISRWLCGTSATPTRPSSSIARRGAGSHDRPRLQPRPCRRLYGLSRPLLPARNRGPSCRRRRNRRIAAEQGFQLWHALGTLHKGAGLLLQGRRRSAPLLPRGFATSGPPGRKSAHRLTSALLGDAYTQSARFDEAHKALDEGLAVVEKNDDRCHEAELYRLRANSLLAESPDQTAAAEACFRQALDTARRQQSRAWELRATTESGPTLATTRAPRRGPRRRSPPSTAHTQKGSQRRTSATPRRYSKPSPDQSDCWIRRAEW